jgi:hypothetical protein
MCQNFENQSRVACDRISHGMKPMKPVRQLRANEKAWRRRLLGFGFGCISEPDGCQLSHHERKTYERELATRPDETTSKCEVMMMCPSMCDSTESLSAC